MIGFKNSFEGYFDSTTLAELTYRCSGLQPCKLNRNTDTLTELSKALQNPNTPIKNYIYILETLVVLPESDVYQIDVAGIFAATGRIMNTRELTEFKRTSEPTKIILEWKKLRETYATNQVLDLTLEPALIIPDDSIILDPRYEFDPAASGPRTDVYTTIPSRSIKKSNPHI